MKNLVEELRWRGLYHDSMPGTEELLTSGPVTAYIGFDPTADSLHIGSMVQIILLCHLRNFGHRAIALVGGATGMIGDPSGKSDERNLLTEEILEANVAGIKNVLSRFLDFEGGGDNDPILVNNYDWMKDFSFIDFARDVGKRITVNYMMAKDSVKKRLTGEVGDDTARHSTSICRPLACAVAGQDARMRGMIEPSAWRSRVASPEVHEIEGSWSSFHGSGKSLLGVLSTTTASAKSQMLSASSFRVRLTAELGEYDLSVMR